MKHLPVVVTLLGLMTFPAAAEDGFLANFFGGAGAGEQQQQTVWGYAGHRHGRHWRHRDASAIPTPENARSFVANASYYGGGPRKYEPNSHTASGERFNQWD